MVAGNKKQIEKTIASDEEGSKHRLKLLLLVTKSNYGGAQRYVHELAEHFANEFDVVVAFGGNGQMAHRLRDSGIRTIQIQNFQREVNLTRDVRACGELWQVLRAERPDIMHLNSSKAGLLGAVIGRAAGVQRVVFTAHGWPFHEPRGLLWKGLTWFGAYSTVLFAHCSIPISDFDLRESSMFGLGGRFTRIIYNGVAAKPLASRAQARATLVGEEDGRRHDKDIWLVTTAELHPKKNIALAIEAVARFNRVADVDRKLFYLIMGDGVLRDELHELIRSRHSEEQIRLLGYVSDAKRFLVAGDVFLLPSKQEGLPFALIEAGIAGLAVIASDVCGIPEVITHQEEGLLFDPWDVESLETALIAATADPRRRAGWGARLKRKIENRFSQDAMFEMTRAVYLEEMDHHR